MNHTQNISNHTQNISWKSCKLKWVSNLQPICTKLANSYRISKYAEKKNFLELRSWGRTYPKRISNQIPNLNVIWLTCDVDTAFGTLSHPPIPSNHRITSRQKLNSPSLNSAHQKKQGPKIGSNEIHPEIWGICRGNMIFKETFHSHFSSFFHWISCHPN